MLEIEGHEFQKELNYKEKIFKVMKEMRIEFGEVMSQIGEVMSQIL